MGPPEVLTYAPVSSRTSSSTFPELDVMPSYPIAMRSMSGLSFVVERRTQWAAMAPKLSVVLIHVE